MIKTPFTDAIEMNVSGKDGMFNGPALMGGGLPQVKGNAGSGGAGEPVQFTTVAHISPKVPADFDESGYIVKL